MDRDANRTRMPVVAAFVDDMREHFGDGIKVTYAREGGVEKGRRGEHGFPAVGLMNCADCGAPAETQHNGQGVCFMCVYGRVT